MSAIQTETVSNPALKWVPLPAPLVLPPPTQLMTRTVGTHKLPCRRCLTDGVAGETMYLVSYNPFPLTANSPYVGPGPIFVHSKDCGRYEGNRVSEQQRQRLLSVRAYDVNHMMVDSATLQGELLVEKAGEMFKDEKVKYLHVHNAGPGCFAVRVERGQTAE